MDDTSFVPKKTTWGWILISVAYLLELVSTIIGLTLIRNLADPSEILSTTMGNVPAIIQGCLAPIAVVLALVAVILVMIERKKLADPHPRMALLALFAYILMAVSNLGIGLPMSFLSTQSGNVSQAMLGLWGSLIGSVLASIYPLLLAFGPAKALQRALLGLASLAGVASAAGMGGLTISNFEMKAMEFGGVTMYYPQQGVNLSTSLDYAFSMAGIAATVFFFLAYLWLAIDAFRRLGQVVDDRVV
jgi:hypothetical protein